MGDFLLKKYVFFHRNLTKSRQIIVQNRHCDIEINIAMSILDYDLPAFCQISVEKNIFFQQKITRFDHFDIKTAWFLSKNSPE